MGFRARSRQGLTSSPHGSVPQALGGRLPRRPLFQHRASNRRRRTGGRLSFLRLGPLHERRSRALGLGRRCKTLLLRRLGSRLTTARDCASRTLADPKDVGVSQGLSQLVGRLRDHGIGTPEDAARNSVGSNCLVRGHGVFVLSLQRKARSRRRGDWKVSFGSAAEDFRRFPGDDGWPLVGRVV